MLKEVSRRAEGRGANNGRENPRMAEVRRTGRERIEKVGRKRAVVVVEEDEKREVVWRVRRSRTGRRSIVRYGGSSGQRLMDSDQIGVPLCHSIGSV